MSTRPAQSRLCSQGLRVGLLRNEIWLELTVAVVATEPSAGVPLWAGGAARLWEIVQQAARLVSAQDGGNAALQVALNSAVEPLRVATECFRVSLKTWILLLRANTAWRAANEL